MGSCRHCGKGDSLLALCTPCCYLTDHPMFYAALEHQPPAEGLARVKHDRDLRRALKYLEEVHPHTEDGDMHYKSEHGFYP